MAPTYRRPLLLVTANAAPLPKVLSTRVVRGWDQMLANATITVPYPPPFHLGKGSAIRIGGGITSIATRFTGYVTGFGASLWPSTWTFPCEDTLWLAKRYKPANTIDLSNATDENAVRVILGTVGAPFIPELIKGTGKKISSLAGQATNWTPKETALSKIQQIDQISTRDHGGGHLTMFRTFADFGGMIRREEIANLPSLTALMSFVEGIDLEEGTSTVEPVEPNTIVVASGQVGVTSTATVSNPWAVVSNPAFVAAPMLQQQASSPTFLSTDDLVRNLAQRYSLNLIRIDFKTWRPDLIPAIATVHFDSDHMGVTLNAFVQSVVTQWLEDGEFSQQVSLISARDLNTNPNALQQFSPLAGGTIPPLPPTPPTPPDTVQAAFEVLAIDVELVLIADVETLLYTAVCVDASTSSGGEIVTRAWSTAGGASPSTGADKYFNPSWTADELPAATVTLEVEDSLGGTDSITIPISLTMGAPVRTQDLFAAATDALEAFNGATRTWTRYTTGITAATVVANGPLWGQGDTVYRSDDYLATAPDTSVPMAGKAVRCIWTELDLNENAVAAGLEDGFVAFSSDGGATWNVKVGPDPPNDVVRVILSRFTPGEVHAITSTGYWTSPDAGDSWSLVRAGDYRDLDLNQFRNWAIEVSGGLGVMIEAPTGTANTGQGGDDLVSTTSHIEADRGYALAADNSAYLLATDGTTTLTAGTAVPAGTPQTRGLRRGAFPDVLYLAVGSGGVYKTVDGLRATYFPLRKPGVEGAGSGPWTAIGAGLLQISAPAPEPESPPGTPGGCVVSVVPLAFVHNVAMDKTTHETRVVSIGTTSGPTFAPNANVVRKYNKDGWIRSEDGLCTSTFGAPSCGTGGSGNWTYDAFHSHICFPSGANVGVWASSDGENYTLLPGGTVAGVGPRAIAAGKTRIWMLIGNQVYHMPLAGGTPTLGGYNGGNALDGALSCARDDDSYCIISVTNVLLGDVWFRITPTSWSGITAEMTGVPVGDSLIPPPIASVDGSIWVGISTSGFVRSTDGAVTWSLVQAQTVAFSARPTYSDTQNRWWAVGPRDGGSVIRAWWSEDDGATWMAQSSLIASGVGSSIAAVGNSP